MSLVPRLSNLSLHLSRSFACLSCALVDSLSRQTRPSGFDRRTGQQSERELVCDRDMERERVRFVKGLLMEDAGGVNLKYS